MDPQPAATPVSLKLLKFDLRGEWEWSLHITHLLSSPGIVSVEFGLVLADENIRVVTGRARLDSWMVMMEESAPFCILFYSTLLRAYNVLRKCLK